MDAIRSERLLELIRWQAEGPLISIYLPTHRTGKEIRQDPIRLKNLLAEAAAELAARGWRARDVEAHLAEATALLADTAFWNRQLDSLALFVARGLTETYRLPRPHPELCLVADHFHLKPLLPLALQDDRFHVLALSKGKVRLFAGGRTEIEELDLGPIPANLEAALGSDLEQQSLQFHSHPSTAPVAGGRGEAIFHGQGGGEDDRETELRRFLEIVDRALLERIGNGKRPLVVAAVEQVAGNFRKLTSYPALLPGFIEGNHDRAEPSALHGKAWPLVESRLAEERERDAARFREIVGTGAASADLKEIASAAQTGRVESLFVAADRQVWGRLNEVGDTEIHRERQPGDGDLLDRLANISLTGGARVHVCPAEQMPSDRLAAAVFRY